MKTVFDKISMGTLTLKNRIIRSATFEVGAAENGKMTSLLSEIYAELADNEVGLIITGMLGAGRNSRAFPGMINTNDDTFISSFAQTASIVHNKGGKIVAQLAHCGVKTGVIDTELAPYGPSEFEISPGHFSKEMSQEEIEQIVQDFGIAAQKCEQAGADGVEIHAAHGYLISQFLSPYYNKRTDKYGGCVENRAKLLLDILDSIRQNTGKDFPVLVKINGEDLIENGFSKEDCLTVCKLLAEQGVDAIEISSGLAIDQTSVPFQKPADDGKGTFTDTAVMIASQVSIPIISVGGYRTIEGIESVLNSSDIIAISMSRPFICEPNLVRRWHSGDTSPAKCISCNRCFGDSFSCALHK